MNSLESDLTYSADVALRATRFFYWRRYFTKFGLLHLGSVVILAGFMVFAYRLRGADWFLGFLGTLLVGNVIMHTAAIVSLPRAVAKSISSLKSPHGHIVLDEEGFTLNVGGNVSKIAWSRFRYVWLRDEFIVLGRSFFGMLHVPTDGMTADVRAEFQRRESNAVGA